MPVVSTSHENEKKTSSAFAQADLHFCFVRRILPYQTQPSLLSVLKVEITQARQDSTGVYSNAIRPVARRGLVMPGATA